jgi:hypothetical protein
MPYDNITYLLCKKNSKLVTKYRFDFDRDSVFEAAGKYVCDTQDDGDYTALALKRGSITQDDGIEIQEIEIGLDNVNLDFKQKVLSNAFEKVKCEVLLDIDGISFVIFSGYVDSIKGDEHWISLSLKSNPTLDQNYPRRIYQTGCNWRFGDEGCNLLPDSYEYIGTLGSASDGITLTISHGQAVDYFVPGFAEITDGDYINEVRPVLSNTGSDVTLRVPFDHSIDAGTGIRLQKLCAKNPDACANTFNNYSRYGGYPHVPKQPII